MTLYTNCREQFPSTYTYCRRQPSQVEGKHPESAQLNACYDNN